MADTATSVLSPVPVQVAAAGTKQQLPSVGTIEARSVMVQALSTNTGTIVVGDTNVVAAAGTHATPTRRGVALAANDTVTFDVIDASALWLDATVSADGVTVVAVLA